MVFQDNNDSLFNVKSALVIVLLLIPLVVYLIQQPRDLPPGPWRIPIIGFLPQLMWFTVYKKEELHVLATRLGQKYGKIYSFDVFGLVFVVINDYSIIKEANNNPLLNNKGFNNEFQYKMFGSVGHSYTHFAEFRKFALKSFRGFGIGKSSFEANIVTEFKALSTELDVFQDKPCNPHKYFVNCVTNVLTAVVFGERHDYDDEDFRYLTDLNSRIMHLLGTVGWAAMLPKYYPNKGTQEMLNLVKDMNQFIDTRIQEHRENVDVENPKDFIDVYLKIMEESPKPDDLFSYLQEENMRASLFMLFFAGADTISTTLDWFCLYMMAYPNIQRKIQDELDSVVGRNRLPQVSDKEQLHYTRAALLEMQRHISLAPLSVFNTACAETSIRGYRIPKGATIVSNIRAVMRDPKVFPQPERFKPERFVDDQGNFIEKEEMCPFGVGRRICLGESLAKMELFIFFTHLLHRYSLVKPDDAPPITMEGTNGLFFAPKPFTVKFDLRI